MDASAVLKLFQQEEGVPCDRCNQEFNPQVLRTHWKEKKLLCEGCFSVVQTGKLIAPEIKREISEIKKRRSMSVADRLGARGVNYECKLCGYKFVRIGDWKGKCPYCDRANCIVPAITAATLVKEVDEIV
ncbi:MAG: hypothetical protein AABX59_02800 [Nanoarchaeota archaeon]